MTEHARFAVFQKRLDFGIDLLKSGLFFKYAVLVRQNDTLFTLSVGKLEPALRVYQQVALLYYIEFFVADDVSENAYFCVKFADAGALYIEKHEFHNF